MDDGIMAALNALRMASDRHTASITQLVYELERSGALDDPAIERLAAVLRGGKPNHPDVPG